MFLRSLASRLPLPKRTRRPATGIAAALTAMVVSACGTSMDAQTNVIYDPGAGVNSRGGGVDVLNALFVANPDGSGTLSTALLNQAAEADELTSLSVTSEGAELAVETDGLPLELVANPRDPLNIEDETPVYVDGVESGRFYTLSITFQNARPVELEVPVVSRGDDPSNDIYASVPTGDAPASTEPIEPTESEPTESEPSEPAKSKPGEPTKSKPGEPTKSTEGSKDKRGAKPGATS